MKEDADNDRIKEVEEILSNIRGLAKNYVEGRIPLCEFYADLSNCLGKLDPIDDALVVLNPDRQYELKFYLKYSGGEFGESESVVPRKKNWRYGDSQKPYSWIDENKFYKTFSSEYRKLNV